MRQDKRYFNIKEYFYLFIAIIFSLTLIFVRDSGFIRYIRVAALNTFVYFKTDALNFKKYSDLSKENIFLKERVVSLIAEKEKYHDAFDENNKLRKYLNIKQTTFYNYVYAKVIGMTPDSYKSTILINVGKKDSICLNAPVISPNGLIGRIKEVGEHTSLVELIIDPKNSIPVKTQIDKIPGIIHPLSSNEAELLEITKSQRIDSAEYIYTSNFSTFFPPDILVGKVSFVSDSSATIHKVIRIEFSEDFNNIHDVFVIKNFDKKNHLDKK